MRSSVLFRGVFPPFLGAAQYYLPTCLLWSGEWGVSLATATLQLSLTCPIPSTTSTTTLSPHPSCTFPFRPRSFSFRLPSPHTTAGHGSTFTASWTKGRLASTRTLRTPVHPTTTSHCSACPTATATSPTATKRRRTSSHLSENPFWWKQKSI